MSFGISKAVVEIPIAAPHSREEFNRENKLFPLVEVLMKHYNIPDAYSFVYATLPFYDEFEDLEVGFEIGEDNKEINGEIDIAIFRIPKVEKEHNITGFKYIGKWQDKDINIEFNEFNKQYTLNGDVIMPFNLIYCGDTKNLVGVILKDKDNDITKALLKGASLEVEQNKMTK